MEKIDVAVQSYNKPESLIYTLLSLKKYSERWIDTVYIQDDCSDNDLVNKVYLSNYFLNAMKPLKIVAIKNSKKCLIYKTMKISEKKCFKNKNYFSSNDIKYQYGINHTNKKYLLIIHDDIKFLDDVCKKYMDFILQNAKEKYALIGDLGQCWICPYSNKCNPDLINKNVFPSRFWPSFVSKVRMKHFCFLILKNICRINEWCCLLNVDIAKELKKHHVYFGQVNTYRGDTATDYFKFIVKKTKYKVYDPLVNDRNQYYKHCWQGHSGHSVWVDQGNGRAKYDYKMIQDKLKSDFGFEYSKI